ncbi:het-domain-containing protein [Fusarium flagelliforme]|uniref:Het-domain-containing protein n=1 Tax=Fusarium flagelliforme TaxID=2675880 RepID=A0A395N2X2_9HYPO|nr:het-domain-containing protein [Fusarium flagelliforme]
MPESDDFITIEECVKPFMFTFEDLKSLQRIYVDEYHNFVTTEECARAFMSRSEHPQNLQRIYVDAFLDLAAERTPGFRLPSDPANCCDLCKELQNLVVRAIGPDLRFESTQALFFSGSRQHLVMKLHVPKDMDPVKGPSRSYFAERCFHIYTHPGILCPWGLFKPYPFQKLEWAFGKLKKCASEHDCYGKDPTPLPTRVLKVGRGPNDVRLQRGAVCARYICLSHCWGSKQPLITTKQNIDNHLVHIAWKDMPLLYQDTIRLAWRLGIEYVWIDSLCIIQDSADDWAREAGRMKDVYGSSWLTIAATSNPDCSSGILENPYDEEAYARFASFKDSLQYSGITRQNESFSWLAVPRDIDICDDEKHEKGACRWPLLTRGWVLQERLLSPRVLYFAAASITLVCGQGSQVEHSAEGNCRVPGHLSVNASDMKSRNKVNSDRWFDFGRLWSHIIQDYSRLKLTDRDDRLSALSGLAQRVFQRQPRGIEYLAGLWSFSLFQGLSWRRLNGMYKAAESGSSRRAILVLGSDKHWSIIPTNALR